MKKNIALVICAAAALTAGCAEKIEELPADNTETQIVSSDTAETADSSVTAEETDVKTTAVSASEPDNTAESFFSLFENSDRKTGRIADTMDKAVRSAADNITVYKLTKNNIKKAEKNDGLSSALFRFSIKSCDGIFSAETDIGIVYACEYTALDKNTYTVIFGGEGTSVFGDAEKYISTCSETEYLAVCTKSGGNYTLIPIAAGNSECGIYAVVPAAEYLGYDMTGVESFNGMPDSLILRITDIYETDDECTLYYSLNSRFEEDVYYYFTNIILNGIDITENVTVDTSSNMIGAGNISFMDISIKSGDALYFTGVVFHSADEEAMYAAELAVVVP